MSDPEKASDIIKRVMPKIKLKYHLKYYKYLDGLRDSGVTNMFGARPYLEMEFGFDKHTASAILSDWMRTYNERHEHDSKKDA